MLDGARLVKFGGTYLYLQDTLKQGCANSGRRLAWTKKFYNMWPNFCGTEV
jgi:hypothetical protein